MKEKWIVIRPCKVWLKPIIQPCIVKVKPMKIIKKINPKVIKRDLPPVLQAVGLKVKTRVETKWEFDSEKNELIEICTLIL